MQPGMTFDLANIAIVLVYAKQSVQLEYTLLFVPMQCETSKGNGPANISVMVPGQSPTVGVRRDQRGLPMAGKA